MPIRLSTHASQESWRLLKLRPRPLLRLASRAWCDGASPKSFAGAFARYLQRQADRHSCTLTVYGETVFVFVARDDLKLVTLFLLPTRFRRLLRRRAVNPADRRLARRRARGSR